MSEIPVEGLFDMDSVGSEFEKDLRDLINRHSMENGSDTPDWLLARYLNKCLETFNSTIRSRERGCPDAKGDPV